MAGNPHVKTTTKVLGLLQHTYLMAKTFAKTGRLIAKPQTRLDRIATCQGCPRYVDGTCSVCGCNLDRTAARSDLLQKTTYAANSCPEGRWDA